MKLYQLLVVIVGIILISVGVSYYKNIPAKEIIEDKEVKIEQIIKSPEFQKQMRDEAERMYYQEVKEEADVRLLELQEGGFSGEKVSLLKDFLGKYESKLIDYADEIIKLDRWVEVVAIAGVETTFCKHGVGDSKNNCGAIKNSKTGEFKVYADPMDSMEDIAYLLQKDLYRDKNITEMNGIYCVDESNRDNKCKGWDNEILEIISNLIT